MARSFRVAVLGAGGLVGETLIKVLEERGFPVSELYALASERSLGRAVEWRGRRLRAIDLKSFDFARADLGFFCAGGAVSRQYAAQAAAAGCVVIDTSGEFRHEEGVPLVVPEVNPQALAGCRERRIVANPSSATIQLVVALKPIHDAVGIERVNVATYQSVSGAGREAVEELAMQSVELLQGRGPVEAAVLPRQIAFNCVPQIDEFLDNGYTREEMQMLRETRTLLGDEAIRVNATTVRVPVFFGHSEVVHLETRQKLGAAAARELLAAAPGVEVIDERVPGGYPTAALEAANHDTVYVGRIREDLSHDRGLNFWIVADNIRKGAATNSVQIAEILVRDNLVRDL
jgi:aspartate-semialdehyde dehydrogenase